MYDLKNCSESSAMLCIWNFVCYTLQQLVVYDYDVAIVKLHRNSIIYNRLSFELDITLAITQAQKPKATNHGRWRDEF